jgi:hypothetical protein
VYGPDDITDLEKRKNPLDENPSPPQFCQVNFTVTNLSPENTQDPLIPLDDIKALGVVGKTTYPNWNFNYHKRSVPSKAIGIKQSAVLNRYVQLSVGQELDGIEFHPYSYPVAGVGIGIKNLP